MPNSTVLQDRRPVMRTYQLRWERVQEFYLPEGCVCTSLSVNPVMGEIMFACRSRGLLHYAWNKDNGVVYANRPCRQSYSDWGNVRLVKCEQETGTYAVVNDRTMALVMVGYQKPEPTDDTMDTAMLSASAAPKHTDLGAPRLLKSSVTESELAYGAEASAQPSTTGYGGGGGNKPRARHHLHEFVVGSGGGGGGVNPVDCLGPKKTANGMECVDYESERCAVGDVRDVAIDTEHERIYLLYRDRLCRRLYPDMRGYSEVVPSQTTKCFGSELVCLAHSRRLLYVLTQAGDIKLRVKLDRMVANSMEQMVWRVVGECLLRFVPKARETLGVYREIAWKIHQINRRSGEYNHAEEKKSQTASVSTVDERAAGGSARTTSIIAEANRKTPADNTPDALAAQRHRVLSSFRDDHDQQDYYRYQSQYENEDFSSDGSGSWEPGRASSLADSYRHSIDSTRASRGAGINMPELAGACVDPRRGILFASTGEPSIYAMWLLSPKPPAIDAATAASATAAAAANVANATASAAAAASIAAVNAAAAGDDWWLEDARIDLAGTPPTKQFVAGPIACVATGWRRPGFLYAVERSTCRRVLVLRYTAECSVGCVGVSIDDNLENISSGGGAGMDEGNEDEASDALSTVSEAAAAAVAADATVDRGSSLAEGGLGESTSVSTYDAGGGGGGGKGGSDFGSLRDTAIFA